MVVAVVCGLLWQKGTVGITVVSDRVIARNVVLNSGTVQIIGNVH